MAVDKQTSGSTTSLHQLEQHDAFVQRHIGPDQADQSAMLEALNLDSLEQLVEQTVPASILLNEPLDLEDNKSEEEALAYLRQLANQNTVNQSYIGMGYYNTHVPAVIQRNILENPGWYTAYTPYQPEYDIGAQFSRRL